MRNIKQLSHKSFKKIIQYCKLMNYDVNDILNMTDHELRLWYERVMELTENDIEFKLTTGMSITDGRRNSG